jgi:peptidoglycan/LPS O-acetylase OafA/YrhL
MDPSAANEDGAPTVAAFPLASSHLQIESTSPKARTVFHLGYRRWLDGLRGVAILLVLAFHLAPVPGGFLGVDVFFVLSGFLITSLLMEEWQSSGAICLKQFYLRRALRLLPAFVLLLFLCCLSIFFLPTSEEKRARLQETAVAACYLSNWPMLHQTSMPILGHTWSLSVEEQFYILWPTLLYGMLRLRLSRRRILLLVCYGIAASVMLRTGLYHWHQNHGLDRATVIFRLYRGLDTRADALLVGCLLGLLAAWNLLPKSRRFIRWTGATSIVSLIYLGFLVSSRRPENSQYYHGLFTVVGLMTAIILARLLSAPARFACRILESAPLVVTGRISYSLYLFHMPILHLLMPMGLYLGSAMGRFWAYAILVFLVVGLSFLAALLSYRFVERPFLRLKDRMRRRIAVNLLTPHRLAESHKSSSSKQAVA